MKKVASFQMALVSILTVFALFKSFHFMTSVFAASLGFSIYFTLKFYLQKKQFLDFANLAHNYSLAPEGNFSRLQTMMLLIGNFAVVGLIFYLPFAFNNASLLVPIIIIYSLHLLLFIVSVKTTEKSELRPFAVIKESVINS